MSAADPASLVIAVPAAVLGAAGFGMATAAQQRATHEVETAPTLSPRLFVALIRRPWWLLGLVMTVLALTLQLVALSFGPLAIVQPLLVTGVVFAGTFAALLHRRLPDRWVLVGALFAAAGLSAFLLLTRPVQPPGREVLDLLGAPAFLVVIVVVVVGCLAYAGTSTHPSRVLALALATGVLYGVTAALMKVVTGALRAGLGELFTEPALYAACVVGPLGFLLSQNTFQQGRLVSPAVAVITTADPIVGVFAGVAWLGERLDTSPGRIAGEVLAGLVVVAGIAMVTLRGSRLLRLGESAEDADVPFVLGREPGAQDARDDAPPDPSTGSGAPRRPGPRR